MQKLYCYVDETGQDQGSTFFLVSVVVLEAEREELIQQLEQIERASGKGRRKWMEARDAQRLNYIQRVLSMPRFRGSLSFAIYPQASNYMA